MIVTTLWFYPTECICVCDITQALQMFYDDDTAQQGNWINKSKKENELAAAQLNKHSA